MAVKDLEKTIFLFMINNYLINLLQIMKIVKSIISIKYIMQYVGKPLLGC